MYPFGKEESASLEQLFQFFCECIRRGDWELAQACIPQLHQWQDGSEKVERILSALIVCPSHVRCSPNRSPQKLAWFWLLVLQKWLAWDKKTVPVVLQRETEFLLLLEELEKDVPHAVLKELYKTFEDRHVLSRKQREESVPKFSAEVIAALRKMLLHAPQKLQTLLELLQRNPVEHSYVLSHSCSPRHIFIDFLWDSLKHLKHLQLNQKLLESDQNKTADEIYNALSMLNVEVEGQTGELRLLFREVLDACWGEHSLLKEERLLGCLLRKGSHALLSLFSSMFLEKTREKLLGPKSPGKGTSELMDAERAVIALFLDHDPAYSWKAAYFYCLGSSKHFLEQILVTALSLMKREDFSSISCLLRQEFSHLSRLLILLGWTQCRSLESAKMLLCTLHKSQGPCNDSVLKDFCDGLYAQVEVLEWCIQQNSNIIPEDVLLQYLHSLESHSSLYLLHHLTSLLALNEEAVIELLQKIPVRETDTQDSVMPISSLLSQQRNLVLFQAFCAMKYAIYALCVNAHKASNCKDCASCFINEFPDELPDHNEQAHQFTSSDYANIFAQYLSKCQRFLRTVPVPLRLELLENIFSLLFVSCSDLCNAGLQETEKAGFEEKNCGDRKLERCTSRDSSTSASPQHSTGPERRPVVHSASVSQEHHGLQKQSDLEVNSSNCDFFRLGYLDLKHFTRDICGFLADDVAMEIFLKMLQDHLKEIESSSPWDSSHVAQEELALLDCLSLSVNRDSFDCRVQLFSKYLSEAQWRHKIVLSNRNTGSQHVPIRTCSNVTRGPTLKKHTQSQKKKSECKREASSAVPESISSELSITTASEGSASTFSDWSDAEYRIKPQQDSLIPMMLSPPESLLVACILRGNYVEAHQVAIMFGLENSASYGELIFLERYQEVIRELAKVEHKIEHQSSEGSGNLKQSGSGRSTLQAIGNAAAAGMVFYSISDVTDKLLAPSDSPIPMLQENFWASSIQLDHSDPLCDVLEGLCPSAMAIFDLASTQCHLWKTCKYLLETAERRLHNSIDVKAQKLESVHQCSDGMRGFPAVLQQISKIISTSHGQPKSEISDEKISSHFHCSIVDLLQSCYPFLTENCITNHIVLSQHFDQILQKLAHVEDSSDSKGNLLASLIEQASLKHAELEAHPVYNQIRLLLRTLDQHAQTMQESCTQDSHVQNTYVQRFFHYINKMAAIVLRSLNPELDQFVELQVGNPFILLQQSPSHLLSQLLFEKQVAPDRLSLLLANEELNLNVQQVIINYCCKALSVCSTKKSNQTRSLVTNISSLVHLHAYHCLPDVEIPVHNPTMDSENAAIHSSSSLYEQNQHMLTASTLNFLKSQSKLTAAMACLSVSRVQRISKQSLSWMEFRGKREVPLSIEQITKECEALLKEFPLLEAFLFTMYEPLRSSQDEGNSLASGLCGKSCISLLFLGLHSDTAIEALMEIFEEALTAGDWPRTLKVLDLYSQDVEDLITVRDAILSCAAADGKESWQYLFPVRNAMLRSRLALRCLDRWPLEACLEILAYCSCDPEVSEELRSDLQSKTRELQVYQKILNLQDIPVWHDWQDLKKTCTDNPQAIIGLILEAKDYELCEEWGDLYPIPRDHLISLHQEHLLHLLEMGDMEKALQLLQRIEDPDIQLVISEQCLDKHPSLAASHFLADYLTTYFYKHLTVMRHNEIQALYVGSKVLLTLPEPYRANYSHLSCKPLLMLEQLLMNLKVDWAAVAVQTLHQLLVGQEIGFTVEDIDALLSKYAGKALDFPFSLKEKRSDSMIQIPESLYRGSESDTLSKSESTDQFPTSFPDTTRSSSPGERNQQQTVSPQEFVPPDKPPPKQQWIPDETEDTCMVCKTERFSMFNRRHHCRRCGRLVCSSCSTKKMVVEACRENPARVCDQCYAYCSKECSTVLPHDQEISKEEAPDKDEVASSSDNECSDFSGVVQISKMADLEWLLSLKEEENEIVRSEFYYEQAPSASLCIAIFNLHSDSIACGHKLIEHCCKLSRGLTNPEVDAGLLTEIMKQLLFSAKMMFVKAGRSQDLALCDSYISKVDVLNILVAAAYRHVPSLDQILQPAAVTRLRNRLLEAEYYQLAVEVSTKTGLDPAGAWHAWGMACLKASNLTAAREKFSRCLKPPLDLNQLNLGSRLVQDVIQYLESTVKPILSVQDDDYFATLRELETILRTRSLSLEMTPEGKIQHNTYYQECLFYLHNYSTNLAIISFYMRHDCMREALLHLLNKESPQEVFIEGIFVPSYKSGKLHMLENLLETIDPGLESWGVYLIAACKHLQKKNYYHILYELQQFMKDQVRAAMTCIRFFTHKAKTYTELGERQKWLLKVKDHLKVYLQEVSRSSGRKKSACSFRKKMSAPDVSRHINTVELQMEVTKFLHRCEKQAASSATAFTVPTLFGNNQMKMEVACKVILEGKNIEEGFGIAFRILQDFQLEAAAVYNKVARQLVKQQNYSEIRQLIKCIKESGAANKNDGDNVILNCLDDFDSVPAEELDNLIQDMESDENKIQAYLRCHKLRSAYLVSVKQENTRAVQLVQHVRQLAEDSGEDVVQAICTQWLSVHHTKPRSWLTQTSKK